MKNLQRKRNRTVSPRSLRKSSTSTVEGQVSSIIAGERIPTDTGYRVMPYSDKFEVYYETMLPGTCSNKFLHDRKDRVLWILGGRGYLRLTVGSVTTERKLIPGDNVVLPKGCMYIVSTMSNQALEFLVVQESKYSSRLKVIEDTAVSKEPNEEDLREPSRADQENGGFPYSRSGKSKAAEQQRLLMQKRQSKQIETLPIDQKLSRTPPERVSAVGGLNVRPTRGRFDDSGAG